MYPPMFIRRKWIVCSIYYLSSLPDTRPPGVFNALIGYLSFHPSIVRSFLSLFRRRLSSLVPVFIFIRILSSITLLVLAYVAQQHSSLPILPGFLCWRSLLDRGVHASRLSFFLSFRVHFIVIRNVQSTFLANFLVKCL